MDIYSLQKINLSVDHCIKYKLIVYTRHYYIVHHYMTLLLLIPTTLYELGLTLER